MIDWRGYHYQNWSFGVSGFIIWELNSSTLLVMDTWLKFTYSSFSDQKTFHFCFSFVVVTYIATDDATLSFMLFTMHFYAASRITSDWAECLHRSIYIDPSICAGPV